MGIVQNNRDLQSELIGAFGLWQIGIFTILGLSIIIHGWQMLANKFLTYPIDHWCARPAQYANFTIEMWLNISAPLLADGTFDRCNSFELDYDETPLMRPDETSPTIACSAWEYKEDLFQVFQTFTIQSCGEMTDLQNMYHIL